MSNTRKSFLLGISAVYLSAFLSYYSQIRGLYGNHGILPANHFLSCKDSDLSPCFFRTPSLVWFSSLVGLNAQYMLELVAVTGVLLSSLCLLFESLLSVPVFSLLWFSYLSLYQVGQTFLWFQWDLLLLEAGFLAIFVSPLDSRQKSDEGCDIAMWLIRWLMFRLMFASGVVKLTSGCPLWWNLKALTVHYESQCIPTPAAWLHHQLPEWFQKLSVVATYGIEIILPFFFFGPTRRLRIIAFYGQILLMGMIMVTGNYNFFNLLTCVLAVSLLDEDWYQRGKARHRSWRSKVSSVTTAAFLSLLVYATVTYFDLRITADWTIESRITFSYAEFQQWLSIATKFSLVLGAISLMFTIGGELWKAKSSLTKVRKVVGISVLSVLLFSISLVQYTHIDDSTHESLWPELHQLYGKFSNLHTFGSYGLFRRMTGATGRPELVLEGANSFDGPWQDLEFKYKPGDISVGPKYCLPHQPRLDWQMWFAALGNYHRNPWLVSLAYRILTGEKEVYRLLDIERASDFSPESPPKFIRGSLYTYRYTNWSESTPDWWHRKFESEYMPIFSADHKPLIEYLTKIKSDSSLKSERMPAVVIFGRRWNLGSDDMVVPGLFLLILNSITIIITSATFPWDTGQSPSTNSSSENHGCIWNSTDGYLGDPGFHYSKLFELVIGHLVVLSTAVLLEISIILVSIRGTIVETSPRNFIIPLLYIRFSIYFVELIWAILSIMWLYRYFPFCRNQASELLVFITVVHLVEITSLVVSMFILYDPAGRSWLKMKNYQRNVENAESKAVQHAKRFSSGRNRNWRQRKVARAYQKSWKHRCSIMCCCVSKSDRQRDSLTEIARLLSEFFRDLDVVPTDILAGLILLRRKQKKERISILAEGKRDTYDFLSGVPVTTSTKFVALSNPAEQMSFQLLVRYMRYAAAAYGWPMYMLMHPVCGCCTLTGVSDCCRRKEMEVFGDNCCRCHLAAASEILQFDDQSEIIFASFEVGVGKTAFYVALDYATKAIVITVRGTLSMEDVLTDLSAESEFLPVEPVREDWVGHRGMVLAALYVRNKLLQLKIIEKAQQADSEQGSLDFRIVLVGHSLGAGTAAILGILLRQKYPNLQCFSYAPPGGLMSSSLAEYSKEFVTSVVVGKDLVPRIGLSQLEMLRVDLTNAIRDSKEPKWKIIASSMLCCQRSAEKGVHRKTVQTSDELNLEQDHSAESANVEAPLTTHPPLYPPGKIIHIVRHHVKDEEQKYEMGWSRFRRRSKPVYQAIWADKTDFDEVIVSPVMIQDHMPDTMLDALEMVLNDRGPAKPPHRPTSGSSSLKLESEVSRLLQTPPLTSTPPRRIFRETSFTSLSPYPYAVSLSSSSNSSRSAGSRHLTSGNLPYGIGIEYLSSLEDEIIAEIRRRELSDPDDVVKAWKGHLFSEWSFSAPVASPEPTSEVSSLRSYRMDSLRHKRSLSDQSRSVRTTFNQTLQTMRELSDSGSVGPLEPLGASQFQYVDTSISEHTGDTSSITFESPLIPVKKRSPVKVIPSLSPQMGSFRREIMELYSRAAKSVRSSSRSSSSSGSQKSTT